MNFGFKHESRGLSNGPQTKRLVRGPSSHATVFTRSADLKEPRSSKMSANASLPVPSAPLPVAGFKDIYDTAAVEKALQDLPHSANEALRALYEKMLRLGGQRFAVKPSALPAMDELHAELPNFGEVLEHVRRQLALCVDSEDDIELPPMLLLGEPGIGKTHFARRVSRLLGTDAAADPPARRAGHRQDAFRAPRLAPAWHRLWLRADELAHRRLGALGRLLAVEEREARQGVRHVPERRVRQPGDRGRRDRQGEQRRPVRPARRALRAAGIADGDALCRRVRRDP